ncbi:mycothiol synthase [Actinophytocola sp.]|uniref:mycothiol synthase n=1 Tax=Actinophytocola sp. TaxID=1872138 RepID=UPI003D6B643B
MTWQESEPGDDVRALLLAAKETDGRPEIEAGRPLPREFRGGLHLLARDTAADENADGSTDAGGREGRLVGYAHLDTGGDAFGNQVAEAIVHPAHRRHGHGARLVAEVLAKASPKLRIWSHGDHPAAARIAERYHLARVRELLKMRLDRRTDLPEPVWPDGVAVRTFIPGQDERELVAVNGRAFDWHPEQSQLTVADVEATERESWFDPAGFFLATSNEKIVGFHWTKTHPGDIGEVYVVGVDPRAQGGGLGRALTLAGLHHLRDKGLGDTILYVESDNAPAVAVYRRLGFTVAEKDVAYQR